MKQLVEQKQRLALEENYRRELQAVKTIQQLKSVYLRHKRRCDALGYLPVSDITFLDEHTRGEVSIATISPEHELHIQQLTNAVQDAVAGEGLQSVVQALQFGSQQSVLSKIQDSITQLLMYLGKDSQLVRYVIEYYKYIYSFRDNTQVIQQCKYYVINSKYQLSQSNYNDDELLEDIFTNYRQLTIKQKYMIKQLLAKLIKQKAMLCQNYLLLPNIQSVINQFVRFSASLSRSTLNVRINKFVQQTNKNKEQQYYIENPAIIATDSGFSDLNDAVIQSRQDGVDIDEGWDDEDSTDKANAAAAQESSAEAAAYFQLAKLSVDRSEEPQNSACSNPPKCQQHDHAHGSFNEKSAEASEEGDGSFDSSSDAGPSQIQSDQDDFD